MHLRAILPGILAILMLGNSCVADACQLACEAPPQSASCAVGSAAGMHAGATAAPMPGMKHCPMCKPKLKTKTAITATRTDAPCSQALCPDALRTQQPAVANDATRATRTVLVPQVAASDATVSSIAVRAALLEPPRLRALSPVSLHRILRL